MGTHPFVLAVTMTPHVREPGSSGEHLFLCTTQADHANFLALSLE